MCVLSRFSCVQLFVTPWTVACQAPCPWDFPGKNTGVGWHDLLQGNPPYPGIELESPVSLTLQADSLPTESSGKPPSSGPDASK